MSIYALAISHIPAQGKGPTLRAALEQHTKVQNAGGGRYTLQERLNGSEPVFNNVMLFDGLAALDAYRAASSGDASQLAPGEAARLSRLSNIGECLARPQGRRLFEVLEVVSPVAPPAYIHRITLVPALGKAGELRKLLADQIKQPMEGVLGRSLSVEVAPESGANFAVLNLYESLASLEKARGAQQSDGAFLAFQAHLATLLAENPHQELHAVLIPYPPAR